ncbi:MAG: hypothetical protein PF689_10745 [Deltaproteobacteria bacterium]|jgi:hypothetical protein|nr:hypothetical protein [Deltaproteobacteria bacterium]
MAANNDKSLEKRLKLIEKNIDKLRVLYEQYFMGIEKTEPVSIRKRLNRELRTLKENPPRNTALKFLLQKVTTKFKTYEQYWNRILRKIEEGTYIRQIKRMRRKVKEEGLSDEPLKGVKTKAELERALEKLNAMREKKEKSAKPSAKPSQKTKKETIDPNIKKTYESFVRARLKTGESLEGVTPERFQATISKQIPRIKKKYNCEEIEIRINIKNGKAVLKFSPRPNK